MRTSVTDKYLELVRGDSAYYSKWLEWSGTEVYVLKLKKDEVEKYMVTFGTSASTFERTPRYYNFKKGYMAVDSLDFGKKENIHDLNILVYLPNTEIDAGDLIQFEKNHKKYTYQIEPLENYQNFLYRTAISLLDVEDVK